MVRPQSGFGTQPPNTVLKAVVCTVHATSTSAITRTEAGVLAWREHPGQPWRAIK